VCAVSGVPFPLIRHRAVNATNTWAFPPAIIVIAVKHSLYLGGSDTVCHILRVEGEELRKILVHTKAGQSVVATGPALIPNRSLVVRRKSIITGPEHGWSKWVQIRVAVHELCHLPEREVPVLATFTCSSGK